MHSSNDDLLTQRKRRRLRILRDQLLGKKTAFFHDLLRFPNNGWLNNFTLDTLLKRHAKNATNQGIFLGQGEAVLGKVTDPAGLNDKQKQINANIDKIINGEKCDNFYRRDPKDVTPPYYFFIMPGNNHFVLVEVTETGHATIYNELPSYDESSKAKLRNLGFANANMSIHARTEAKYTQPDSWSCGDRAIRRLFEQLGIDDPIRHANNSQELRENTRRLLNAHFEQKEDVRELQREIDEINAELSSRGINSDETTNTSTLCNPADTNTPPDNRPSFLTETIAQTVKTNMTAQGWDTTENKSGGKLTSITFEKKGSADQSFLMSDNSFHTCSDNIETFKAMMQAFKLAHPTASPLVTTDSEDCAKLWKRAYCEVFGKSSAPADLVKLENAKSTPEPARTFKRP